jgi:protein-S-isoprenylcysteine O-methyltransferase Ste14
MFVSAGKISWIYTWIYIVASILVIFINSLIFPSELISERGHTVAVGGPYSYIRHPGYLGMMVYLLSTPVILGSLWGLIPAILTIILFIIRTTFEDKTLKKKLEGYKEYAKKVESRLIPGVW